MLMSGIRLFRRPGFRIIMVIVALLILVGITLLVNSLISDMQKDRMAREGLARSINAQVSISGVGVTNQDIGNVADKRVIQAIIDDCRLATSLWTGKSVNEMPDRIKFLIRQEAVSPHEYYAVYVDDMGDPLIINIQNGNFIILDENQYNDVLNVVRKGFYNSPAMTVRSGEKSIQAVGRWINSYNKITKVAADSIVLGAHGIEPYLTYLPIDFTRSAKGGSQPFATYVNGKEKYGDFVLYDAEMNKIGIIGMSGLAPQIDMLSDLTSGRYVVEMHTRFETPLSESGYQYFFGIIIP